MYNSDCIRLEQIDPSRKKLREVPYNKALGPLHIWPEVEGKRSRLLYIDATVVVIIEHEVRQLH